MNNQFDELTKRCARSVTRRGALTRSGIGFAAMAVAMLITTTSQSAAPNAVTSMVFDPAGDAVFPYDLYNAPVPAYLDVTRASVSSAHGVFHFEIQVATEIPSNADPGFTPGVNHLGPTFGLLTDPATAESPIHFFGHSDHYMFNYYVGALYSVGESGAGLGLGWHGFLIDLSTFSVVEIPLQIKKDTLVVEIDAASIGNPSSMGWLVGSECDPFPIPEEKTKTAVLVDFAPDHGYAIWSSQ